MSSSTPKAPKEASPQAQAAANIDLARRQAAIDRPTQITPLGTSTWSGDVENATNTVSLSPQMQQQFQGVTGIANALIPQVQTNYSAGSVPGFNPANANFTNDVAAARDAAYKYATSDLDPQFAEQQDQLTQQLADRGIPIGSEAYNLAMDQFGRSKSGAYENARNQAYLQGLQAENQGFTQGMQGRQQLFQEQQQPLSALGQLLNLEMGGQFQPYQFNSPTIAPIQYNTNPVQKQPSPWLGLLSAGLGAGGTAGGLAMASDRRLKQDITPVAATWGGCPVYEFSYVWAPDVKQYGCMYDEVKELRPEAAVLICGVGHVDYARL